MFHIVVRRTADNWDAIHGLVQRHELPLITSERRPDAVAPADWCKYILARHRPTGRDVADDVIDALTGDGRAAMAMIDEVAKGLDLSKKIADAALRLRTERADLRGRWGAFVTGGPATDFTALNTAEGPAIDELLRADATLALEFYPTYTDYCDSGATAAQRDQWMADFFQGESGAFPQPRLRWLVRRRRELGSRSRLTVLFPTTDVDDVNFLGSTEPDVFLDRIFYVWATRSGFRSLMLADNGGIGTYKWDEKVSHPARDTTFVEYWEHYCRDGLRTTLRGRPGCPGPGASDSAAAEQAVGAERRSLRAPANAGRTSKH